MDIFRKLYYKLTLLFCIVVSFIYIFNRENGGIGFASLYIIVGLLCFGSWSIGKKEIDTEKIIRNIFLLLLWSMLGFGMMAVGIISLIGTVNDNGLLMGFIAIFLLILIVLYIISIIKNKDLFAILSILLLFSGLVLAGFSTGILVLALLSLLILLASAVCFVVSLIKGVIS